MSRRILSLAVYLLRTGIFSLPGLLFVLLALVFYLVLFDPRQRTPDREYYILVIGLLGILLTFLITVTTAARANQAVHFPFLVRLPSRVEYLTATFAASIVFSSALQAVVAVFALAVNGPDFSFGQFLTIPPLWVAANVLFAVLALHATDLVASGWSRVYVFGTLALLLYIHSILDTLVNWLAGLMNRVSSLFFDIGVSSLSSFFSEVDVWLQTSGIEVLSSAIGLIFWPFRAIADAVIAGHFNQLQALAPAMLLIYATVLFLLAADFFSTKDLFLSE